MQPTKPRIPGEPPFILDKTERYDGGPVGVCFSCLNKIDKKEPREYLIWWTWHEPESLIFGGTINKKVGEWVKDEDVFHTLCTEKFIGRLRMERPAHESEDNTQT